MNPTKEPIRPVQDVLSESRLLNIVKSPTKTLLEKFELIEKFAKNRRISFIDTLKYIRLALVSQKNGGVRYPKLITTLQSAYNVLNPPVPVLSSKGEYVEMGDGLKWATCNLGASKPQDNGDYYAWAETSVKYTGLSPLTWKQGVVRGYWSDSYKYNSPDGSLNSFIANKYTQSDGKTVLDPADDAARVILKGNWRLPTKAEWNRLLDKNNFTWTYVNVGDVKGYIVTSKVKGYEGNKIFLPAASDFFETCHRFKGENVFRGCYWSSTSEKDQKYYHLAHSLCFADSFIDVCQDYRYLGKSVRPVFK